jgi:hypothetical protein
MRPSPEMRFARTLALAVTALGASATMAEPRLRGGLSLGAHAGVAGHALTMGPVLAFDLGTVVSSEWAIAARLSAGGILIVNMARVGVGAEYSAGERWTLGFGVGTALFISSNRDQPGALSVVAPVRVDYALGDHASVKLKRHGWILSFEVLPGLAVIQGCGLRPSGVPCVSAPLTLAGLIGVGYAWR